MNKPLFFCILVLFVFLSSQCARKAQCPGQFGKASLDKKQTEQEVVTAKKVHQSQLSEGEQL